jgi:hypothetical protein
MLIEAISILGPIREIPPTIMAIPMEIKRQILILKATLRNLSTLKKLLTPW